jgi:hypothetical protein
MATARDHVKAALRLCGIRLPTETQQEEGLSRLNRLLAAWSAERLMTFPHVVEESFTLVAGTATYTIGAAGTFNTVRPMRIPTAFLRDSSAIDFWLDTTMSLDDYAQIADKVTRARPARLYYAPEAPLGKIHFDTPPDAAYTFRAYSWKPLSAIATLDTASALPGEYEKVLVYSLAVDLAPEYSVALDQTVIQQAVGGHASLRDLNRPAIAYARHDPALVRALLR